MQRSESATTEGVFYFATSDSVVVVLGGIFVVIGLGIWQWVSGELTWFSALSFCFVTCLLIVVVMELRRPIPALQVIAGGIWTSYLGGVPWEKLERVVVLEKEDDDGVVSLVLQIFLLGNENKDGKPDEELSLHQIRNYQEIRPEIEKYRWMRRRKQLGQEMEMNK